MKQLRLIDKVGECNDDQNEQRHNGQQRVIGDATCQEQSLIGAKAPQDLERKGARVLQYQPSPGSENVHLPRLVDAEQLYCLPVESIS